MSNLKYIFTTTGDVYTGVEFFEPHIDEYIVLIQLDKVKEYNDLSRNERTIEVINKYGKAVRKDIIAKEFEGDFDSKNRIDNKTISFDHYSEYKLMFVFGAGASAHCVFGDDTDKFQYDKLKPPLGAGLFESRFKSFYEKYKGVKQSLHYLQEKNIDLEEILENEWKQISENSNNSFHKRHINIQYYLQDILYNTSMRVINDFYAKNLYARLADKLQQLYDSQKTGSNYKKNKIAFTSFNQDIILEHFITEYFGKKIENMDDYVDLEESPFIIFKPHGSSNWGWEFSDITRFETNTSSWLFENKINYYNLYFELLGDHFNMIDPRSWNHNYFLDEHKIGKFTIDKSKICIVDGKDNNKFFPALLLPYRDKDEFTMPLHHFDIMKEYFARLEMLVLIGWKGNENIFNKQLELKANNLKKVIIVDPCPKIVKENINPILAKKNIEPIYYESFEEFVNKGVEKELKEVFIN